MRTIENVINNMVIDGLDEIAPKWLDGQEFNVPHLTSHVSNDDVRPEDLEAIKDSLSMIARDYGLEVKYGSRKQENDTAQFVEQRDDYGKVISQF